MKRIGWRLQKVTNNGILVETNAGQKCSWHDCHHVRTGESNNVTSLGHRRARYIYVRDDQKDRREFISEKETKSQRDSYLCTSSKCRRAPCRIAKWRLGRENPGKDGRRFHFPRMRLICMFWLRILTSDLSTLVLILSS